MPDNYMNPEFEMPVPGGALQQQGMSVDYLKQQQSDNVSIHELEQENLIERVRQKLAGEFLNPNTGKFEKVPGIKPPMNAEGVYYFMLKLGSHLDKNITLSELSEEKIGEMLIEINNAILYVIWQRSESFKLDKEYIDFVCDILDHHIYSNYSRARNGGERTHRETVLKEISTIVDRQQAPPSTGFGSLFNPFKKFKQQEGEMNG